MNPNTKNYHIGLEVSNLIILEKRDEVRDYGKPRLSMEEYLVQPLCCPEIRGKKGSPFWIKRQILNTRVYKKVVHCRKCSYKMLHDDNAHKRAAEAKATKKPKNTRPHPKEDGQVYVEGWGVTLGRMGRLHESGNEGSAHGRSRRRIDRA